MTGTRVKVHFKGKDAEIQRLSAHFRSYSAHVGHDTPNVVEEFLTKGNGLAVNFLFALGYRWA